MPFEVILYKKVQIRKISTAFVSKKLSERFKIITALNKK